MEVTVRAGRAGTVVVGRRPAAPAGSGLVLLAGVDVHVDPSAPDEPPFALVHDTAEAEAGLRALYGAEVADAVRAAEGGADAGRAASESAGAPIAVVPGRAAAPTRRMGLVRWLEAYSPDDLPATLLDLEFGAAAAELDHLLADTDADEAADRLRRRAGTAAALARRLRAEGARDAPAGLADLLAAALPATAAVVPLDDPAADDVAHEVELAAALRALGAAGLVPDWDSLTSRPGVALRIPVGAGWRNAPPELLDVDRTASVDWWQVPRGLLRTDEDTITWRLTEGGTAVQVAVVAAVRAPAAVLGFRLHSDAGPMPVAVGALRLSADGRVFEGAAPVHGEPTGLLVLDVHDPAAGRPARLGADRTSARATRWAARGISAVRLGSSALEAIDEAAHLFERVAGEHRRPADRRRAARRGARCRAVEQTLLGQLGELTAEDVRAGPPGSDVQPSDLQPSDLRPPDLRAASWRPLVAEVALAADRGWWG
jgi:hypothetical protein